MDNSLQKYMNQNLRDSIADLKVVQGTAKDSGNIYYAIEIVFINGYSKRIFLTGAEQFAWVNAFEQLQTQIQVDRTF